MVFLATTRASIYRGQTTPVEGLDPVDNNVTPVAGLESLPASLIEKSRKVYDQTSQQQRTIRWCVGRFTPGTDIRAGDRVKDNRTGIFYVLDELTTKPRSIAGQSDLILDLRIV